MASTDVTVVSLGPFLTLQWSEYICNSSRLWISRLLRISKLPSLDEHLTIFTNSICLFFLRTLFAELWTQSKPDDGRWSPTGGRIRDGWPLTRLRSYTLNQTRLSCETNIPPDCSAADVSNFSMIRSYYALTGVWCRLLASLVAQHELWTAEHSCCC